MTRITTPIQKRKRKGSKYIIIGIDGLQMVFTRAEWRSAIKRRIDWDNESPIDYGRRGW